MISFSTAGLFPRTTIESLRIIEKAGYDYAELMPQSPGEAEPRFAVEILRNSRVKVTSIHFPLVLFPVFYNPYPEMVKESRKVSENLAVMGSILKTRVIVVHPPFFNDETVGVIFKEPVLGNIRHLCQIAKEFGIMITLENSPKGGRTAEELKNIVREIDCDNIGFTIDTTEAVESGQDPVELLKELKPSHVHLSDHVRDEKHLLPGDGDLNWREIISALKNIEYSGFLVVEPSYRYLMEEPVEKLKRVRSFLEGLI